MRLALFSLLSLFLCSCAVFDGYKDNQHSWYANSLPDSEKALIDQGAVIEIDLNSDTQKGKLLAMRGDPEIGKYNFVEIGEWFEEYKYSSGDFVSGTATNKILYDQYGNILVFSGVQNQRKPKTLTELHEMTSQFILVDNDSILIQEFKITKDGKPFYGSTTATLDWKKPLSDRLKKKHLTGAEYYYDKEGNVKKTKNHPTVEQIKNTFKKQP